MRIGLIGAGRIGGTLAELAVGHGRDVVVSNSRGPQTLADLIAQLGEHAVAGTGSSPSSTTAAPPAASCWQPTCPARTW